MHEVTIRQAGAADAAAIGAMHTQAWRESYTGLIEQSFIDGQTTQQKAWLWGKILAVHDPVHLVLLAEDADGILGFGRAAPNRDDPREIPGEIQSVYLLDRAKGSGVAQRLMAGLADHLAAQNLFPALVWTLAENARAVAFYRKLGAQPLTSRSVGFGDQRLTELCFTWPDRAAFLA